MNLETIVITGASRGIGAAVARRLAAPRRHLVLLARSPALLEERAAEARSRGAEATPISVDFADAASLERALDRLEEQPLPIDGLILNAGIANDLRFFEADRASVQREIDVNYLAPAELLRRTLPGMTRRGAGRVVVVGSLTSFVPFPGNASYSASKAALFALIRSVRMELDDDRVHIGVVLPGHTKTAMTENRSSYIPPMLPEAVADAVAESYERRRQLVVPGMLNRVAAKMFTAFPSTSDRMLTRLARYVIPQPI